MQYTIRNVPPHLDTLLRERAKAERRSLNDVVLEALTQGLGLSDRPTRYRDLSDIAGTWVDDPETDAALDEQRRVDPDLWK